MMKNTIVYLLLLSFYSCHKHPIEVTQALKFAGNNRKELETVLDNYKKEDKLKYQSACYIIKNMPYHKSSTQIHIDSSYISFFYKIDSVYNIIFGNMDTLEVLTANPKGYDSLRIELAPVFNQLPAPKLIHTDEWDITAEFLIKNIEEAIYMWRHSPYLKNMPFDEFKEVILPYRVTNENLMIDKRRIRSMYESILLPSDKYTPITAPWNALKPM